MKDYIEGLDKEAERRFISPTIELRAEGDSNIIEGIASAVDKDYDMGWYRERIAKGAFDSVLQDDVVALFNHDTNYPLARTTATGESKLELFTTDAGDLGYRFNAPNTTVGKDMIENIRTGIIAKSSFAFTIEKEKWETNREDDVPDLRTITKVKRLYDVSPVTYPASNLTSVAARSLERSQLPSKEIEADRIAMDRDLRKLDI